MHKSVLIKIAVRRMLEITFLLVFCLLVKCAEISDNTDITDKYCCSSFVVVFGTSFYAQSSDNSNTKYDQSPESAN